MSQGMDDKIRQISEMLNSPEAQDGIMNLFSSLGRPRETVSDAAGQQMSELADSEQLQQTASPRSAGESDWIYHLQNMLGQMNTVQDSRVNLLRSVHPFLNPTRRDRCATCMNILKVASLLRTLTNNGGRLL